MTTAPDWAAYEAMLASEIAELEELDESEEAV